MMRRVHVDCGPWLSRARVHLGHGGASRRDADRRGRQVGAEVKADGGSGWPRLLSPNLQLYDAEVPHHVERACCAGGDAGRRHSPSEMDLREGGLPPQGGRVAAIGDLAKHDSAHASAEQGDQARAWQARLLGPRRSREPAVHAVGVLIDSIVRQPSARAAAGATPPSRPSFALCTRPAVAHAQRLVSTPPPSATGGRFSSVWFSQLSPEGVGMSEPPSGLRPMAPADACTASLVERFRACTAGGGCVGSGGSFGSLAPREDSSARAPVRLTPALCAREGVGRAACEGLAVGQEATTGAWMGLPSAAPCVTRSPRFCSRAIPRA